MPQVGRMSNAERFQRNFQKFTTVIQTNFRRFRINAVRYCRDEINEKIEDVMSVKNAHRELVVQTSVFWVVAFLIAGVMLQVQHVDFGIQQSHAHSFLQVRGDGTENAILGNVRNDNEAEDASLILSSSSCPGSPQRCRKQRKPVVTMTQEEQRNADGAEFDVEFLLPEEIVQFRTKPSEYNWLEKRCRIRKVSVKPIDTIREGFKKLLEKQTTEITADGSEHIILPRLRQVFKYKDVAQPRSPSSSRFHPRDKEQEYKVLNDQRSFSYYGIQSHDGEPPLIEVTCEEGWDKEIPETYDSLKDIFKKYGDGIFFNAGDRVIARLGKLQIPGTITAVRDIHNECYMVTDSLSEDMAQKLRTDIQEKMHEWEKVKETSVCVVQRHGRPVLPKTRLWSRGKHEENRAISVGAKVIIKPPVKRFRRSYKVQYKKSKASNEVLEYETWHNHWNGREAIVYQSKATEPKWWLKLPSEENVICLDSHLLEVLVKRRFDIRLRQEDVRPAFSIGEVVNLRQNERMDCTILSFHKLDFNGMDSNVEKHKSSDTRKTGDEPKGDQSMSDNVNPAQENSTTENWSIVNRALKENKFRRFSAPVQNMEDVVKNQRPHGFCVVECYAWPEDLDSFLFKDKQVLSMKSENISKTFSFEAKDLKHDSVYVDTAGTICFLHVIPTDKKKKTGIWQETKEDEDSQIEGIRKAPLEFHNRMDFRITQVKGNDRKLKWNRNCFDPKWDIWKDNAGDKSKNKQADLKKLFHEAFGPYDEDHRPPTKFVITLEATKIHARIKVKQSDLRRRDWLEGDIVYLPKDLEVRKRLTDTYSLKPDLAWDTVCQSGGILYTTDEVLGNHSAEDENWYNVGEAYFETLKKAKHKLYFESRSIAKTEWLILRPHKDLHLPVGNYVQVRKDWVVKDREDRPASEKYGTGQLHLRFHGNPKKDHLHEFYEYPDYLKLRVPRWDTYDAEEFCNHKQYLRQEGELRVWKCLGHGPRKRTLCGECGLDLDFKEQTKVEDKFNEDEKKEEQCDSCAKTFQWGLAHFSHEHCQYHLCAECGFQGLGHPYGWRGFHGDPYDDHTFMVYHDEGSKSQSQNLNSCVTLSSCWFRQNLTWETIQLRGGIRYFRDGGEDWSSVIFERRYEDLKKYEYVGVRKTSEPGWLILRFKTDNDFCTQLRVRESWVIHETDFCSNKEKVPGHENKWRCLGHDLDFVTKQKKLNEINSNLGKWNERLTQFQPTPKEKRGSLGFTDSFTGSFTDSFTDNIGSSSFSGMNQWLFGEDDDLQQLPSPPVLQPPQSPPDRPRSVSGPQDFQPSQSPPDRPLSASGNLLDAQSNLTPGGALNIVGFHDTEIELAKKIRREEDRKAKLLDLGTGEITHRFHGEPESDPNTRERRFRFGQDKNTIKEDLSKKYTDKDNVLEEYRNGDSVYYWDTRKKFEIPAIIIDVYCDDNVDKYKIRAENGSQHTDYDADQKCLRPRWKGGDKAVLKKVDKVGDEYAALNGVVVKLMEKLDTYYKWSRQATQEGNAPTEWIVEFHEGGQNAGDEKVMEALNDIFVEHPPGSGMKRAYFEEDYFEQHVEKAASAQFVHDAEFCCSHRQLLNKDEYGCQFYACLGHHVPGTQLVTFKFGVLEKTLEDIIKKQRKSTIEIKDRIGIFLGSNSCDVIQAPLMTMQAKQTHSKEYACKDDAQKTQTVFQNQEGHIIGKQANGLYSVKVTINGKEFILVDVPGRDVQPKNQIDGSLADVEKFDKDSRINTEDWNLGAPVELSDLYMETKLADSLNWQTVDQNGGIQFSKERDMDKADSVGGWPRLVQSRFEELKKENFVSDIVQDDGDGLVILEVPVKKEYRLLRVRKDWITTKPFAKRLVPELTHCKVQGQGQAVLLIDDDYYLKLRAWIPGVNDGKPMDLVVRRKFFAALQRPPRDYEDQMREKDKVILKHCKNLCCTIKEIIKRDTDNLEGGDSDILLMLEYTGARYTFQQSGVKMSQIISYFDSQTTLSKVTVELLMKKADVEIIPQDYQFVRFNRDRPVFTEVPETKLSWPFLTALQKFLYYFLAHLGCIRTAQFFWKPTSYLGINFREDREDAVILSVDPTGWAGFFYENTEPPLYKFKGWRIREVNGLRVKSLQHYYELMKCVNVKEAMSVKLRHMSQKYIDDPDTHRRVPVSDIGTSRQVLYQVAAQCEGIDMEGLSTSNKVWRLLKEWWKAFFPIVLQGIMLGLLWEIGTWVTDDIDDYKLDWYDEDLVDDDDENGVNKALNAELMEVNDSPGVGYVVTALVIFIYDVFTYFTGPSLRCFFCAVNTKYWKHPFPSAAKAVSWSLWFGEFAIGFILGIFGFRSLILSETKVDLLFDAVSLHFILDIDDYIQHLTPNVGCLTEMVVPEYVVMPATTQELLEGRFHTWYTVTYVVEIAFIALPYYPILFAVLGYYTFQCWPGVPIWTLSVCLPLMLLPLFFECHQLPREFKEIADT